ncbi:MAG TPA: hypothetical protein VGW99_03590, partial [Chthoniobacterales bacterium]|nr:hypothetical protein [Chthoniobacterales bacterium]
FRRVRSLDLNRAFLRNGDGAPSHQAQSQASLLRKKIGNSIANGMLPAKLQAGDSPISQVRPQPLFCFSCPFPEISGPSDGHSLTLVLSLRERKVGTFVLFSPNRCYGAVE